MPATMMPGMVPGMAAGMGQTGPSSTTQPLSQSKAAAAKKKPPPEPKEVEPPPFDPEIKELCEKFEIEEKCARKLDAVMAGRADTKKSDLAKLFDLLEDVGSPTCLLELKISEMEEGEFVGKILEDREVEALTLNFDLKGEAKDKLNEVVSRRQTRKGEDLVRMESILEHARNPNEIATRLAGQLLDGRIPALPDLSEAEDVMKKFKLEPEAKRTLAEIVFARQEDSSRVLGYLEVYLEASHKPSADLIALKGRLLAGGEVPSAPGGGAPDRSRSRDRGRGRGGAQKGGDRNRRKSSRSPPRGRRSPPSRSKRSRSTSRRSRSRGR